MRIGFTGTSDMMRVKFTEGPFSSPDEFPKWRTLAASFSGSIDLWARGRSLQEKQLQL
jgi:hypothetical protein